MKYLILFPLLLVACEESPRPFGRSKPFDQSVEEMIEEDNTNEEIPLLDPRNRR